jgi:hypothetical protein
MQSQLVKLFLAFSPLFQNKNKKVNLDNVLCTRLYSGNENLLTEMHKRFYCLCQPLFSADKIAFEVTFP